MRHGYLFSGEVEERLRVLLQNVYDQTAALQRTTERTFAALHTC